MQALRNQDITYVKGIGPERAKLLQKELGVFSALDLLRHYPSGYVDRSRAYRISDLQGDMPWVLLTGRFVAFSEHGEGAKMRLVGLFTDGTGTIEVVWFRKIQLLKKAYHAGVNYVLFGKPQQFNGRWSVVHP